MFETFESSLSLSVSFGLAVVEPNDKPGAVVRKKELWVALATPTERRRREGLQKQMGERIKLNATENLETENCAQSSDTLRQANNQLSKQKSCELDPGRWSSSVQKASEDLCSH